MNKIYGIILTLTAGLFFLIGGLISSKVSNKDKLNNFSIALAFIIMLSLVLFDLFPENLELLEEYSTISKTIIIGLFIIVGLLILKILDIFIPDHHHEHHDNEKKQKRAHITYSSY